MDFCIHGYHVLLCTQCKEFLHSIFLLSLKTNVIGNKTLLANTCIFSDSNTTQASTFE